MQFLQPVKTAAIAVGLIVLISGCAVQKSLTPELIEKTKSMAVYSVVPEGAPTVFVKGGGSGVMQGGLIGGAIDGFIAARRRAKLMKRMAPISRAAADFNFREAVWSRHQSAILHAKWFKVSKFEQHHALTAGEFRKLKLPFIILNTSYRFAPRFQVLNVQTFATIFVTSHEQADSFTRYFSYSPRIGTKRNAPGFWAENQAALLRKEALAGLDRNIEMLKYDLLSHPDKKKTETGEAIKFRWRDPDSRIKLNFSGTLIKRTNDRILMREKGGNMFSIPTSFREF
jgi:hypothetical protein